MGNAAVDNAKNLRRVSMTPLGSTESDEQRNADGVRLRGTLGGEQTTE
jgi:hypothetical protein